MAMRILRLGLRHRGIVTVALLAGLLLNLFVVARLSPPDLLNGDLPMAARCQGGGPGCAEQPLIPPPVGGLPQFDPPPPPVFGQLAIVTPAPSPAVREAPPVLLEPPPRLVAVA